MTVASPKLDNSPNGTSLLPDDERWFCAHSLERSVRLWSGLILMTFVLTHFLNHATGIFGVAAMSEVQNWRSSLWRSWPGTILLYGSLSAHVILALRRALGRRTWRMPVMEAFQILLGILIPLLLLKHVIGTRALSSAAGTDDSYINVLRYLWPDNALLMASAICVVWVHGTIGLYYYFSIRQWFRNLRVPFFVISAIIPLLALAGFVSAGRESLRLATPVEQWKAQQSSAYDQLLSNGWMVLYAAFAACVAVVLLKFVRARFKTSVTINYTGHGEATAATGLTLLEMSRLNGIPHPSTCGGRGRCSSCRVLVMSGDENATPPSMLEQRMLDRIRAPRQVRLACQYKPKQDVSVRVLMSSRDKNIQDMASIELQEWGTEQQLAVLFADIRGFSTLTRNQIPADIFVLLSRVITDMTQATEARGGRVVMTQTDGIMAVFGIGRDAKTGSRAALNAAADILKSIQLINKDMRGALPLPLRVGIGIHTGPVVLSRNDDDTSGDIIAVGETVSIASRLEDATKEATADCLVSAATLAAANFAMPAMASRPFHYKNGDQPIAAYAFGDRQDLRLLLGRADRDTPSKTGKQSRTSEATA